MFNQNFYNAYAVNYDAGFAITDNFTVLEQVVNNFSNLKIVEVQTIENAYFLACNEYVTEKIKNFPHLQPLVPKFDDVLKYPFIEMGHILSIPANRFFACVHPKYVGILTTVPNLLSFFSKFHFVIMKEFLNVMEATQWINANFLEKIYTVSAYIEQPVPFLSNIPLDTVIPVNNFETAIENAKVPQNLQNSTFFKKLFLNTNEHNRPLKEPVKVIPPEKRS